MRLRMKAGPGALLVALIALTISGSEDDWIEQALGHQDREASQTELLEPDEHVFVEDFGDNGPDETPGDVKSQSEANQKSFQAEKAGKKEQLAASDPAALRWTGGRGEESFEKFMFKRSQKAKPAAKSGAKPGAKQGAKPAVKSAAKPEKEGGDGDDGGEEELLAVKQLVYNDYCQKVVSDCQSQIQKTVGENGFQAVTPLGHDENWNEMPDTVSLIEADVEDDEGAAPAPAPAPADAAPAPAPAPAPADAAPAPAPAPAPADAAPAPAPAPESKQEKAADAAAKAEEVIHENPKKDEPLEKATTDLKGEAKQKTAAEKKAKAKAKIVTNEALSKQKHKGIPASSKAQATPAVKKAAQDGMKNGMEHEKTNKVKEKEMKTASKKPAKEMKPMTVGGKQSDKEVEKKNLEKEMAKLRASAEYKKMMKTITLGGGKTASLQKSTTAKAHSKSDGKSDGGDDAAFSKEMKVKKLAVGKTKGKAGKGTAPASSDDDDSSENDDSEPEPKKKKSRKEAEDEEDKEIESYQKVAMKAAKEERQTDHPMAYIDLGMEERVAQCIAAQSSSYCNAP